MSKLIDPRDGEFLTTREVCQRYQISRTTWHEWRTRGIAPRGVELAPSVLRWRLDDLREWERKRG